MVCFTLISCYSYTFQVSFKNSKSFFFIWLNCKNSLINFDIWQPNFLFAPGKNSDIFKMRVGQFIANSRLIWLKEHISLFWLEIFLKCSKWSRLSSFSKHTRSLVEYRSITNTSVVRIYDEKNVKLKKKLLKKKPVWSLKLPGLMNCSLNFLATIGDAVVPDLHCSSSL